MKSTSKKRAARFSQRETKSFSNILQISALKFLTAKLRIIQMDPNTKDNFKVISVMVKESTIMPITTSTSANGQMIYSTDKAATFSLQVRDSKDNSVKVAKKEMDYTSTQMEIAIKVNGLTTKSTDKVCTLIFHPESDMKVIR